MFTNAAIIASKMEDDLRMRILSLAQSTAHWRGTGMWSIGTYEFNSNPISSQWHDLYMVANCAKRFKQRNHRNTFKILGKARSSS